jgi:hypothetical protein
LPQVVGDGRDLLFSLKKYLQQISQKVNQLGDGRLAARDLTASAVPTTGAYAKGDFVANSNPVELGAAASKYVVTGWICTVGGNPATFVQARVLTGN